MPNNDQSYHPTNTSALDVLLERDYVEDQKIFRAYDPQAGRRVGDADFNFWAKSSYWTPEEIIALSLGKDPHAVNFQECNQRLHKFPICREYIDRSILVGRALETEQLFQATIPGFAIAWLDRWRISYPAQLRFEVEALDHQIADWKQHYLDVSQRANELEDYLREAVGLHDATVEQLSEERSKYQAWAQQALSTMDNQATQLHRLAVENHELEETIEQLTTESLKTSNTGQLSSRERASLLKMISAMAIEGYRYDPTELKSEVPREIESDIAKVGESLGAETIRKFLKEATSACDKRNAN